MNFYTWLLDNRNKNEKLSHLADYMENLTKRAGLTRTHRMAENGLQFWKNLVSDIDTKLTKEMELELESAYKVFSGDITGLEISSDKSGERVSSDKSNDNDKS